MRAFLKLGGIALLGYLPFASAQDSDPNKVMKKITVVDELDATTEGSGSYTTGAMNTATKLPMSIRETPQSVSVITRQEIEDRNIVNLDEAMETAVGVIASTANFNRISYTARGFAITDNMIDGVPAVGNAYAGYVPNLAFFDRVEIIRGGAGLTYGGVSLVGSAGGTVNLVRKRPTVDTQISTVVRRGSFNNNYVELDGSTKLNASGSLRGRLVASYEDRETFIDLESSRKPAFYGILEADLGERTTATLGGSIERYDGNFAPYGLPRYTDGGDLGLSRSSRGMAPAYNEYFTDVDSLFVEVAHNINDRWTVKATANYQERDQGGLTINTTGAVNRTTLLGPTYGTTVSDSVSPDERRAADLIVSGNFDAFGRTHEVAFGGTWAENEGQRARTASGTAPAVTQNIFNFDPYLVAQPALGAWVPSATASTSTTSGIYAMTRLAIADPLKVILGGRVSSVESETRNFNTGARSSTKESDVFTPYAGVVYDVSEHWSTYASYADIFRPQNTLYQANGDPLEPVVGANYELGLKGEHYEGRLNTTLAVFRIEETNRSQVDPDNLQPCAGSPTLSDCYLAEGKVRGEGFEAEIAGELLPGWQTTAGYTFVETEYLRDRTRTGAPSADEGKSFRTTTPKHLFRVWTTYHLPGGLKSWSVGGGISAQSEIYALTNGIRFEQESLALLNARVGYDISETWNVSLNVNNLLDEKYYQRLGSLTSGNRYGEPRAVLVSLRGKW